MCVRVCPSVLLQLTGESDWEVHEEVSAILRQSCCYCGQSDSLGNQIAVKVLEVNLFVERFLECNKLYGPQCFVQWVPTGVASGSTQADIIFCYFLC